MALRGKLKLEMEQPSLLDMLTKKWKWKKEFPRTTKANSLVYNFMPQNKDIKSKSI